MVVLYEPYVLISNRYIHIRFLNPQKGHGKHLWVMQGMFRANGGCGYVKKPDFLLSAGSPRDMNFYPNGHRPVQTILQVRACLTIL